MLSSARALLVLAVCCRPRAHPPTPPVTCVLGTVECNSVNCHLNKISTEEDKFIGQKSQLSELLLSLVLGKNGGGELGVAPRIFTDH